jgi:hypothetical protein
MPLQTAMLVKKMISWYFLVKFHPDAGSLYAVQQVPFFGRKPNCRLGSRFEAHLGTDELPKFSFFAALKNGPDV